MLKQIDENPGYEDRESGKNQHLDRTSQGNERDYEGKVVVNSITPQVYCQQDYGVDD